jgi:hypothetical protein
VQLSAEELHFLSANMTASLSAFERVEADIGTPSSLLYWPKCSLIIIINNTNNFMAGKGTQEAVLSVAGNQIKASRGN